MNAQELKRHLTDNDIRKILQSLGGEIYFEDEQTIILNTICHHGNSKNKLYYYKDTDINKFRYKTTEIFHCYTDCGDSFDIIELVCRNKDFNMRESINYICTQLGISTIKEGFTDESIKLIDDWSFINSYKKHKRSKEKEEYKDFYDKKILNIFQDIYTSEWNNEGISNEVMKMFDIKYSTLQQKIIIPHYDINGRLMGVRGRAIIEEEAEMFGKYTPFQIHKVMYNHPLSQNLYGIHKNKECIKTLKKVMLVESEKGVLQASTMFGIENNFTLALCGNKLSTFQRDLLLSLEIDEVIIAVDRQYKVVGDDEYNKWLKHVKDKIINIISPYVRVYVIWDTENILDYKQSPTDVSKEKLLKLMKNKIYIPT